jgi:uncharacterized membrane protein YczE
MHVPPVVRGGVAARSASLLAGLFLCGLGIVLMVEAGLGLSPWDVLQQGISENTPLSFGLANIAVGLVVLVVSRLLGARVGPGTIANVTLIGLFVDGLAAIDAVEELSDAALPVRILLFAVAIVLFGVGSGLYIGADMGAGPRDSLMLVLAARLRTRISVVRGAIEIAVSVLGFALGGTLGIGTVAFALTIGPSVELGFWLVVAIRMADRRAGASPVAATIDAR